MKKYILPIAALVIIGFASCAENAAPEKETVIIREKEVPVKEVVPVKEEGTSIRIGNDGVDVKSDNVKVDVNTEQPKK